MAALPETSQLPVHMSVSHLKLTGQKRKVSRAVILLIQLQKLLLKHGKLRI